MKIHHCGVECDSNSLSKYSGSQDSPWIVIDATTRHIQQKLQRFDRHFKAATLKIVIVAPFVYPRLVEFVYFDIQSTRQKSQCVNTVSSHSVPVQDLCVRDVRRRNVSVQDIQVRNFRANKGLLLKNHHWPPMWVEDIRRGGVWHSRR